LVNFENAVQAIFYNDFLGKQELINLQATTAQHLFLVKVSYSCVIKAQDMFSLKDTL
jgi:hypothetical protein